MATPVSVPHLDFQQLMENRNERDREEKKEIWDAIHQGSVSITNLTAAVDNLARELLNDRKQRQEHDRQNAVRRDKNSNRLFAVALAAIAAFLAVAFNNMVGLLEWGEAVISGLAL